MSLRGSLARIFLGRDGRVRLLWRAVIFYLLVDELAPLVLDPLLGFAEQRLQMPEGLSASNVALNEIENFIAALIVTALLALYEGRRVDSYGLPLAGAFSGQTAQGALVGALMAGLVALGMYALGGMQVHGLAITGSTLATAALAWLGANLCVGVAEEFVYRSYFLQTLWKSIGFWLASIVIAVLFAADHYFFKPGENLWDVITLMSLSLLLCYSVLRTGTLWFAVGFHIAFDYLQLFVIGTPNGSAIPQGRMLNVTFEGPAWLTGGVLGTEASMLMYPVIALAWLYVGKCLPAAGSAGRRSDRLRS